MDNTINQTIIEKVVIQKTAIYKAIAMLPPPEIKDLWAEKNSTDQKVNLTKKEEFVKENSITETKTDSTPKDWRDITDPKLRRKMRMKDYSKVYQEANKEKLKEYKKSYYIDNKEKLYKQQVEWKRKNKDNIQYKLACRLRKGLNRDSLNRKQKSGSAVKDLGCTIDELKVYLESKFQPGMSWDNYGLHGWHIDHIKPLASFDLTNREQLLEACHYTNLQPLWASDNLSKGDKLI